ncbi:hypothetical protein JD276_04400 [Leucobacter sp. CSA1]|uniref:Minor tail protein n=1 Tax=Leucobacter chromiisoli TaxID=2796471 RepID=A0A934Q606_9MICO|nr:hypothetical protein [Leucobacter chromiisoli]MBK0418271.1 hypothetical protein [Leucobacter chromiisoli]
MLRYIVERASDGRFLELDIPIDVTGASRVLCGPGRLSGSIAPDLGDLRTATGDLLIDQYAAFVHEEADGVIRGTWLATRSAYPDEEWTIEGAGFSAFLDGRPYTGEYNGVNVDVADVVRHIWAHVQSQTRSNINVTVTGSTGVKVGTSSDQALAQAQSAATAAKAAADAAKRNLDAARAQAKASPTPANKALVESRKAQSDAANAAKKAADARLSAAKTRVKEDGGAWKILWWDTPDCLTEMQDAIEEAGHEWVEWSGWNADRTRILKEIRILPRVGRRQDELAFIEGDNIIEAVTVEADSAEFANQVVAIGAGEGRAALRVTLTENDGRLVKPYVLDAKHVTKKSVLETLARNELARRSVPFRVAAIRVDTSHPNAPRGSFQVGDEILVDCTVSRLGRKQLWRRIEEIDWIDLDTCDLMLGDAL